MGLLTIRLLWLGQNQWLLWHQLQNGALLLFAFFMISDPLTTPRRAPVRVLYALLVACLAFIWQFYFFKPHGPVLALALLSVTVPWLNRRYPGASFSWKPLQSELRTLPT
jgi:enediyne biosynthesis protein E5